jgi:hypothetical protein
MRESVSQSRARRPDWAKYAPHVGSVVTTQLHRIVGHGRVSRSGHLIEPGDETVATSRKSLNESRTIGGISQGLAQSIHNGVYTMVEVNESFRRPKLLSEFVAGSPFRRGVLEAAVRLGMIG